MPVAIGVAAALVKTDAQPALGVIRLDAIVTDAHGRTVENLTPADFEITEGNVPQAIDAVRFIRAEGARPSEIVRPIASRSDEQAEAARDDVRLFAIFLDEYHVSPGEGVVGARALLARLIERELTPRDLVLVVRPLDSLPNLRLTRDFGRALDAVASFEGRSGDYAARSAFEQNFIAASPTRIDAVRTQIVTSALNALAVHMGALNGGRKTMVVVSEGFARAPRRRGDEPLPTLESLIRSANRGGVAVYPIDPRAFADRLVAGDATARPETSAAALANRDMLQALADETNGSPLLAAQDVEAWTRRVIGDSSAYYVVTFQPRSPDAGRFHPVQVQVRRTGLTVRARKGYWTPSADELLRARLAAKASEPARALSPPLRSSPLIRPWFGMARGDGGKTRVSFVWEPVAPVPGDRVRRPAPARIALKAFEGDVAVFEGVVVPTAAGGPRRDPANALVRATFEVAPGRVRLEMSIQDETSRQLDVDVRELRVGGLAGVVDLGTIEVLRARNAREYRQLAADPDATPVAMREFSRSDRLLVRVPVYGGRGTPDVSARLLAQRGAVMRTVLVEPVGGGPLRQVDLPLAGLVTGEYSVEVVATDPVGGAQAKTSVRFRLTP